MLMTLEKLKTAHVLEDLKKKKTNEETAFSGQCMKQLTEHHENSREFLGVGGIAEEGGLLISKGPISLFPLFPQTAFTVLTS